MRNFNTFLVFRSPWPPQALRNCDTTLRSTSLLQRISTCYLSLGHAHPWSPQPVRGVSTFHVFAPVGAIATPLFFRSPGSPQPLRGAHTFLVFRSLWPPQALRNRDTSLFSDPPGRHNRCLASTYFCLFCPPRSPKPLLSFNTLLVVLAPLGRHSRCVMPTQCVLLALPWSSLALRSFNTCLCYRHPGRHNKCVVSTH